MNPFEPPQVKVDVAGPRKPRSQWMLWVGIGTPILIVLFCGGLLFTAEDPQKKSRREWEHLYLMQQELLADAAAAVRRTLDDPAAKLPDVMQIEGDPRLSSTETVQIHASVTSDKIAGNGVSLVTVKFRRSNGAACGFEVSQVIVGGESREFKAGEFKRPAGGVPQKP